MKLKLIRMYFKPTYTIGKLYIDGVYQCDTLEDPPRDIKIKGETCIPKGVYKVIINMSARFKKLMPLLINVPDFEGVRIHSGNTSKDTEGCPLVGQNKLVGKVVNSRLEFDKLMEKIISFKDDLEIEITHI